MSLKRICATCLNEVKNPAPGYAGCTRGYHNCCGDKWEAKPGLLTNRQAVHLINALSHLVVTLQDQFGKSAPHNYVEIELWAVGGILEQLHANLAESVGEDEDEPVTPRAQDLNEYINVLKWAVCVFELEQKRIIKDKALDN